MPSKDDLPLEIARRLADGDAVDMSAAGENLDPELARGLKKLGKLLEPAEGASATAARSTETQPPQRRTDRFIGEYRIVRQLGAGGMGIVYEAEQKHPKRAVALKVIRGGGHVDEHQIKMFRREAHTLGRLKHPSIAAIYEMGRTDDGQHFFAMELVRGETLGEWLKHNPQSGLKTRLSIFGKICDAVAYAHQRGVIHRDLKPSNVLVPMDAAGSSAPSPDAPVPDIKVLDFGLARITEHDMTLSTVVSELGSVRGTLPYMSPEQVRGNPDEIDLRTDVYSLGVMLYEMLTGRLPYEIQGKSLPEAVRVICEEPPVSLTQTWSGTRKPAADVVTIAHKALEKQPARRYRTVAALADDVQRYLSDQPILARPPSAIYQFRKLVARHRYAFGVLAGLFVLLTAFGITMAAQARRIARERDRAAQEAATSREVEKFLVGTYENPDPDVSKGEAVTARELLDRGVVTIEKLKAEPRVQVRLMMAMYGSYLGLGLNEKAKGVAERALKIEETIPDADPDVTRTLRGDLANVLLLLGSLDEAQRSHQAIYDEEVRNGRAEGFGAYEALYGVGLALQKAGKFAESESYYRKALAGLQRVAADHFRTFEAMTGLAITRGSLGDFGEAEVLLRAAYEGRLRTLGAGSSATLEAMSVLGFTYMQLGRYAEAEPLLRGAWEQQRKLLGDDHPSLIESTNGLATLLQSMERYEEAQLHFERALVLVEKSFGGEHPSMQIALNNLALIQMLQGRWAEALDPMRRAFELGGKLYPPESPNMILIEGNYGEVLAWTGHAREGLGHVDRALAVARRNWPDGHSIVARMARKRASVLIAAGEFDAAERDALEAQQDLERFHGPNHTHTRVAMRTLLTLYERWGRPQQAQVWRAKLASAPPGQAPPGQAPPA